MSDLTSNPHFRGANYAEIPAEPYAIAQAALALAYEQRTANLIAWHAVIDSEDPRTEDLYCEIHDRIFGRYSDLTPGAKSGIHPQTSPYSTK